VAAPETQYAKAADGVHVAYQISGTGDTDLVLLHGTVSHLEIAWEDPMLRRLYERLGSFGRLIRFDRRGMGMSDTLDELPSFDEQIADFGTVMDAAGSWRAAVMGTGDAGMLALAFAAAHPDRVSAVVAYEVSPRLMPSPNDEFGVDPAELQKMAAASAALDLDAHLAIVAPARKDEPGFKPWFRRFTRSASSGFRIEAFIRSQATWDITGLLDRVQARVLVMNRTGNTILPMRSVRALTVALPNAQLAEIEGTGTAIYADDVEQIADEIEGFLTGTPPLPRRDRVLATVLFTDVVGSTQRAAALGDRDWRALLSRHNALVRAELDRFGGHEISTAGDGFLATFDSPRRAIECARAAANSVRGIGLEIRAGVHTGEIELSGDDIQGLAVHIGARVAGLAGAGQVFVSSTVKDLVVGSGIEFADRGGRELKGVPGSWRIYEVV
jgi:class 3 adenylate cyclase